MSGQRVHPTLRSPRRTDIVPQHKTRHLSPGDNVPGTLRETPRGYPRTAAGEPQLQPRLSRTTVARAAVHPPVRGSAQAGLMVCDERRTRAQGSAEPQKKLRTRERENPTMWRRVVKKGGAVGGRLASGLMMGGVSPPRRELSCYYGTWIRRGMDAPGPGNDLVFCSRIVGMGRVVTSLCPGTFCLA